MEECCCWIHFYFGHQSSCLASRLDAFSLKPLPPHHINALIVDSASDLTQFFNFQRVTDLQMRCGHNMSNACLAVLEFQNLTSESLVSVQSILNVTELVLLILDLSSLDPFHFGGYSCWFLMKHWQSSITNAA